MSLTILADLAVAMVRTLGEKAPLMGVENSNSEQTSQLKHSSVKRMLAKINLGQLVLEMQQFLFEIFTKRSV